jgi:hypothetical protein
MIIYVLVLKAKKKAAQGLSPRHPKELPAQQKLIYLKNSAVIQA